MTATPSPHISIPELFAVEVSTPYIHGAFWSDDGKRVYFASSSSDEKKLLRWASYDIATRSVIGVPSPSKYDPGIWQRLNVSEPLGGIDLYPELQGHVSPSGKRVIYAVVYSHPGTPPPFDPSSRVEVWVADLDRHYKIKLLATSFVGDVYQAAWFKNETKIVFSLAYDSAGLYVADIQKGTSILLDKMSSVEYGGAPTGWSVSPDGTTLAVIDWTGKLCLVSLKDGRSSVVEGPASEPTWSKDSKRLYYWWASGENMDTIHSYEVASGNISTLVSKPMFRDSGLQDLANSPFAVSPDGSKIVFWPGSLWLVELQK
jgi:Tol biopolymer transport system component